MVDDVLLVLHTISSATQDTTVSCVACVVVSTMDNTYVYGVVIVKNN